MQHWHKGFHGGKSGGRSRDQVFLFVSAYQSVEDGGHLYPVSSVSFFMSQQELDVKDNLVS